MSNRQQKFHNTILDELKLGIYGSPERGDDRYYANVTFKNAYENDPDCHPGSYTYTYQKMRRVGQNTYKTLHNKEGEFMDFDSGRYHVSTAHDLRAWADVHPGERARGKGAEDSQLYQFLDAAGHEDIKNYLYQQGPDGKMEVNKENWQERVYNPELRGHLVEVEGKVGQSIAAYSWQKLESYQIDKHIAGEPNNRYPNVFRGAPLRIENPNDPQGKRTVQVAESGVMNPNNIKGAVKPFQYNPQRDIQFKEAGGRDRLAESFRRRAERHSDNLAVRRAQEAVQAKEGPGMSQAELKQLEQERLDAQVARRARAKQGPEASQEKRGISHEDVDLAF